MAQSGADDSGVGAGAHHQTAVLHVGEYDMDDARFRIRPYQQVVSSCTGAFITSLTMTPLDVIKTRLQTQQKKLLSDKCFVYCNGLMDHLCPCYPVAPGNGSAVLTSTLATGAPPSLPLSSRSLTMGGPTIHPHPRSNTGLAPLAAEHYTGTIDALAKISRHEGVKTLWSGLGPTLVLAIPATVIYFVFYEQLRVRMKDQYFRQFPDHSKDHPPFFIPLLAGMTARITSVTVVNPMELVRTKMQSQRMSYFEVRNALHSVVQHEGYRGLWRGLGSTLCRDVPFSGIYWTTYEALKRHADVQSTPGFWFSFSAGAASGCLAALLTTPFDVIKTHRQIEFGERFLYPDTAVRVQPTRDTLQMIGHIYRLNGVAGLFAGVTPRLFKISPACAIMIGSFEYGKAFFHERNVRVYHMHGGGGGSAGGGSKVMHADYAPLGDAAKRI